MKNRVQQLVFVTISLFLTIPPLARADAPRLRIVRVGVAVTEDVKTDLAWKEKFKQRLAYASKIFDTAFKIRFEPAEFYEWSLATDKLDSKLLFEDLKNAFPLENVKTDLVIGLTRLKQLKDLGNLQDFDVIGRTRPFSGYIVIRVPQNPLLKIQEETVLTHELGHLFGAVHTTNPDSIMAPIAGRQIPTAFDSSNREIIMLLREFDFRRSAHAIEERVVPQLLSSYVTLVNTDQPVDFYYVLGVFYLKMGQAEEARKAWEVGLKLEPDNGQLLHDFGVLQLKMGMKSEARETLSRAVDQLGSPADKLMKASALNRLGAAYYEEKNYQAAHYSWSRAAVLDPQNLDISINLAMGDTRRGRYQEAIQSLLKLTVNHQRNPKLLGSIGAAYFYNGEHQKAIDYLGRALRLTKGQKLKGELTDLNMDQPSQINSLLGDVYLKLRAGNDALKSYKASCDMNPTLECHKRLGQLFYQMGKWNECVKELAAVLSVEQENEDLYGALGVCFTQKGEKKKAEAVFSEGLRHVKTKETRALLRKNLGHLYIGLQKWEAAERELQFAVNDNWKDPETHLAMAVIYLAKNLVVDAHRSVKTALSIDPNHPKAKEMLRKIETNLKPTA